MSYCMQIRAGRIDPVGHRHASDHSGQAAGFAPVDVGFQSGFEPALQPAATWPQVGPVRVGA
jgi:hypothetical protein